MSGVTGLLASAQRHRLGLFTLAVLVLLAWVVWSARGALPAFVIGGAVAFVLDPPVSALQARGVPRWAGILVMYAVVVALAWAFVAFAIGPIAAQTRAFIDDLPRLGMAIVDVERAIEDWYRSLPVSPEVRAFFDDAIQRGQAQLVDLARAIIGPTIGTLLRTVTFIFGLIVVPVWLFFVLKDRERLPAVVAHALPAEWQPDALGVLAILGRVGGRWVRGELLLGAAVFLATAAGFGILTLVGFSEFGKFILVLALIAGVLEWFPVIGPIIAAVPALLVGISISPAAALAAIAVSTAVQQLENNLLVPKVMGDAVELHPAVMIPSLVAGGALFGIGGAILAAPVVAAGRDLYRYTSRRLAAQPAGTALEAAMHRGPTSAAPQEPDLESHGPPGSSAPPPAGRGDEGEPAATPEPATGEDA